MSATLHERSRRRQPDSPAVERLAHKSEWLTFARHALAASRDSGPRKKETRMHTRSIFAALAVSLASSTALAQAAEWTIDTGHAHVGFSVDHMVVSEVDGQFKTFNGKVLLDEKDPSKSLVDFTIDAASIDTDHAERDKHLKSADFFDTAKYPQITFKSKKIKKAGKAYKVTGDLSMHGVTKEVTLDVTLSEAITNPWGKQVRGVRVDGVVKRSDFGITWNKALDKGGLALGDEVDIVIKLELNK
jgi:polyisoprenoid-binding protein YceI